MFPKDVHAPSGRLRRMAVTRTARACLITLGAVVALALAAPNAASAHHVIGHPATPTDVDDAWYVAAHRAELHGMDFNRAVLDDALLQQMYKNEPGLSPFDAQVRLERFHQEAAKERAFEGLGSDASFGE